MMAYRVVVAISLLLIAAGISYAAGQPPAMNPRGYFVQNTHEFQQDVSGEGYAMIYQNVNTNNLSMKNYMHGSGVMDMAALINSQQPKSQHVVYYAQNANYAYIMTNYKNYNSFINFTEQNEMTQTPVAFAYGTGWYSNHPVVFNSLLKERTVGKNYQAGSEMLHQVEYARGFNKDVGLLLSCTGPTNTNIGVGTAKMNLEESVTQGTVNVKELLTQITENGQTISVKNPLILMDENYVGNFKIKKGMMIEVYKEPLANATDWLPCCFGGYFDIAQPQLQTQYGESGIFDCTCRAQSLKTYEPPWNGSVAQFPGEAYKYGPVVVREKVPALRAVRPPSDAY
jgi:hypothetical protein